nr:hypothetical protein [uncultured Flavonifractor sp.]
MAQLEEQLNQILGDPQAMEQIMSLAQSLSGSRESPPPDQSSPGETEAPPEGGTAVPSPLSALADLDPRLLRMGMTLLSEYSAQDDKKAALLSALKPFLKPERQEKIDQAVRIARLTRVVRAAFSLFRDRGEEEDDV